MYEDFTLRKKRLKKRGRKRNPLPVVVFFVLILLIVFLRRNQTQRTSTVTPLAETENASQNTNSLFDTLSAFVSRDEEEEINSEEELMTAIKNRIEEEQGFYSVYIQDITTGHSFGINDTTMLRGASVNKIPTLAALYYLAKDDTIDLDDRITLQSKDIQDFGTGILRYKEPGTTYSIKTLANYLIKKSDNTAGYIIGEQMIGYEKIEELLEIWGLTQTDMKQNKTSNQDMARLLIKMYRGEITTDALTKEMMGFFVDTDFENRIPRHLPKTITVYHKIGNEVGNIHDVGIVEFPEHPYYIGVITNDIIDIERTEDMIAEISKMVFDFYTKKVTDSTSFSF